MSENAEPAESGQPDPADPFAGLVLDDEFVKAARTREAAAADRVHRAGRIAREHHRLESEREILGRAPTGAVPHHRRRRMIITLAVVVAVALITWIVLSSHAASSPGSTGAGALALTLR